MIKIDIFDKINNKWIVSFIKQIIHRCSCKVISSYIRKFSTFQKEVFDRARLWGGVGPPWKDPPPI